MVTILPALRQVREDLVNLLDRATVERLCHDMGHPSFLTPWYSPPDGQDTILASIPRHSAYRLDLHGQAALAARVG